MTPDYGQYSKKELEEALGSIDRARFPERVQQIEKALADIDARNEQADYSDEEILLPEPEQFTAEKARHHALGLLAKLLGGILVVAMLLPVYFYSFLLDNDMVATFKWLAWLTAALVFIFTCKKWLHTDQLRKANAMLIAKGKRPMTVNSPRRYASVICMASFMAVFSAFLTYRAIPGALHLYLLDKQSAYQVVTIAKLPHRYRRKHCNGKVYLQEYAPQFFDYICGITPREKWEQLQPGQKIRLLGSRSSLGFLAERALVN